VTDPAGRRLTTAALHEHWDNAVPVLIPIAGTPQLRLRVDPPCGRLTLRAPIAPATEVPSNTLAHVAVETMFEGGDRFVEISTTDARLILDGYAMLMGIADRIQLDGLAPLAALEQTIATWHSILARRVRMSPQAEIGLFGELLVVRALIEAATASAAAWRGGLSEEHDFGFGDADVEAKTTSGDKRHHWIHGLTQLVQTGDTPLWLLSVQITRGGDTQGQTLPELIDELLATTSGADRRRIAQNLVTVGWDDDQGELFDERWRLRSAPELFRVDADFPRLTPTLLSGAGIDVGALCQVFYEIDLSGHEPSPDPPGVLAKIVSHMRAPFND
jgi:hypothetical protein